MRFYVIKLPKWLSTVVVWITKIFISKEDD